MSFNKYLEKLFYLYSENIVQGLIAKIDKFDKKKMRAYVVPLLQDENEAESVDWPVLPNIPVLFLKSGDYYIRPDYKKDDLVWVTFSSFDIDNALEDKKRPKSEGMFSKENACVVAGLSLDNWAFPNNFNEDGLLLGNLDGSVFLNICNDQIKGKGTKLVWEGDFEIQGKIIHTGDYEIEGNIKQTGDLEVDGNMRINTTGLVVEK